MMMTLRLSERANDITSSQWALVAGLNEDSGLTLRRYFVSLWRHFVSLWRRWLCGLAKQESNYFYLFLFCRIWLRVFIVTRWILMRNGVCRWGTSMKIIFLSLWHTDDRPRWEWPFLWHTDDRPHWWWTSLMDLTDDEPDWWTSPRMIFCLSQNPNDRPL